MKKPNPAIYIMANRRNGTIYTGVTSNLPTRVHQHTTAEFVHEVVNAKDKIIKP